MSRRGFFLWRETDVQGRDLKECFLRQETWWWSSYSAGHQVRRHTHTPPHTLTHMHPHITFHYIRLMSYVSSGCSDCPHSAVVPDVLDQGWTTQSVCSLHNTGAFQKKKTRHDLKRGIQSFLLCLNRRFYYCFCSSQAASVSLQGFLNSMVYAWRRPNFTEAVLGENTPLVGYNRLAFFDESLRSSSCWLQTHRDTFMLLQLALAWGTLAVRPQGSSLHRSLDWNIQRSHSQTEHEEKQNGRSFF